MAEIQGYCTTIDPLTRHEGAMSRAASARGKTWTPGEILNVFFMNGHPTFHDAVRRHVKTWEQFANIRFNFVSDPHAVIRVSFEPPFTTIGQFNSALGRDATQIDSRQPTMNLGFFPNTDPLEVQRLVLHEFGHTLGLIHEHQSPSSGIVFNRATVFDHFARFGFTRPMVESNILARFSHADISNSTEFDPKSIMLYSFPASIATPATGNNQSLSDKDKELIARVYPRAGDPTPDPGRPPVGIPLTVDALPAPGFLVLAGTQLVYNFEVATKGTYVMETSGDQAWVMSLFAQGDMSEPLQVDDAGSGHRLNALIRRELKPGVYFLVLRHLLPEGVGSFSIVVRKHQTATPEVTRTRTTRKAPKTATSKRTKRG